MRGRIVEHAPEALSPGARVLEVGSGAHGHVFFLDAALRRVGVDPLAREYARLFPKWAGAPDVRVLSADGEALPFCDGAFDVVISDNVVDHAHGPRAIVAEMARVLRPGGLLYFTVHIHHPFWATAARVHDAASERLPGLAIAAFSDHTTHFTASAARALFDGLALTVLDDDDGIARAKVRSPWPWNRALWKNARFERIAQKS